MRGPWLLCSHLQLHAPTRATAPHIMCVDLRYSVAARVSITEPCETHGVCKQCCWAGAGADGQPAAGRHRQSARRPPARSPTAGRRRPAGCWPAAVPQCLGAPTRPNLSWCPAGRQPEMRFVKSSIPKKRARGLRSLKNRPGGMARVWRNCWFEDSFELWKLRGDREGGDGGWPAASQPASRQQASQPTASQLAQPANQQASNGGRRQRRSWPASQQWEPVN